MRPDEIFRFQNLRVIEQTGEGDTDARPFRISRQRPWKQKAGQPQGALVEPGCDFYVAVVSDKYRHDPDNAGLAAAIDELRRHVNHGLAIAALAAFLLRASATLIIVQFLV